MKCAFVFFHTQNLHIYTYTNTLSQLTEKQLILSVEVEMYANSGAIMLITARKRTIERYKKRKKKHCGCSLIFCIKYELKEDRKEYRRIETIIYNNKAQINKCLTFSI